MIHFRKREGDKTDDHCHAMYLLLHSARYLLVIPNMHIASLAYVGPGQVPVMGHLFVVAEEMARRENVTLSGYRLTLNQGPDAQQTIAHPHVHLMGGRQLGDMG